jgi:hypothetical protein
VRKNSEGEDGKDRRGEVVVVEGETSELRKDEARFLEGLCPEENPAHAN